MSSCDLVDKGFLSLKAYNHIMGIELIDFNYYKQPDSIFRLKTHFHPPTYKITIDGYILAKSNLKFISKHNIYLLKFLIGDDTDEIWVCLWENSDIFPYHLQMFPNGSKDPKKRFHISLKNASLVFNEHFNCNELSVNSYDNITINL